MDTLLQVMICTFGPEGLTRVAAMQLPSVHGVGYLVSCQSRPTDLPPELRRPDVEVHFTPTRGLSANRNHALSLATAPYLLVADDDLRYTARGLAEALAAFTSHPEADVLLFRFGFPTPRVYPPGECELPRPWKRHNPVSVEIGLRRAAVERLRLRFSTLMGIGAPYLTCGEEDMLIHNARRRGARIVFVPVEPGSHPETPTLRRGRRPVGALRAAGAVIALQYPWTAALRLPLVAWRQPGRWWHCLRAMLQGAAYGLRHCRELKLML